MKRSLPESKDPIDGSTDVDDGKMKKIRASENDPAPVTEAGTEETAVDVLLDENLLYEILKHVDARTLGAASCVNRQWHRTAEDERLWELICTRHWSNMGCGNNQLRSVVLALGGFRRLHAHYLWPLSKPSSTTAAAASSSSWPCLPPARTIGLSKPISPKIRWGKDEVQLSLSLLSIRFYEKMNYSNRSK